MSPKLSYPYYAFGEQLDSAPSLFDTHKIIQCRAGGVIRMKPGMYKSATLGIFVSLLAFTGCTDPTSENRMHEVTRSFIIERLVPAVESYKEDTDTYPGNLAGLKALVVEPDDVSGWDGPYIPEIPLDPWGNAYRYCSPGIHNPDSYDLWSLGPDGVPSDDDIGNW